jgi:hypothetical protein
MGVLEMILDPLVLVVEVALVLLVVMLLPVKEVTVDPEQHHLFQEYR